MPSHADPQQDVSGKTESAPLRGRVQRKCACGGSAGLAGECDGCRRRRMLGAAVQAKLDVHGPADALEQEADRVAEQVIRISDTAAPPDGSLVRAAPLVRGRVAANGAPAVGPAPSVVGGVLSSPGQPLDPGSRAFFERRFGHDFSRVRVHTDRKAAESAQAVTALAYTVGEHIGFGSGRFAPGTDEGRRLIAHELAHVVQQSHGVSPIAPTAPGHRRRSAHSTPEARGRLLRQPDFAATMDRKYKFSAILIMISSVPKTSLASVIPSTQAKAQALEAMEIYRAMTPAERRSAISDHFASGRIARLLWALPEEAAQSFPVELHEVLRSVGAQAIGATDDTDQQARGSDLVVYTGGQSGHLQVIKGGRWIYAAPAVSGHPGHGENEPGEGPIPSGRYVMHPGITRNPVTGIEYGVCGANPISHGYQEITSTHAEPCEGAHYCNVPCPTEGEPERKCYTPRDCWGPYRIKIEGSKAVTTPSGSRRVRSGFYLHGGNPADAVSSGCVKSLDDGVFAKIRTLTGVKGAVPFCVGAVCADEVNRAVTETVSQATAAAFGVAGEKHQ